ncbi:hypothetical protein EAF00_005302 [Botryotinia globosa]|nr:hypothetical protein EAF00_005302 [Botryotinia globosa]
MITLSDFTRLSPCIYIHDPSESTTSFSSSSLPPKTKSSPKSPDLILLTSWLNASPKHISKYTTLYHSLHPNTPILLLTTSTPHIFTSSTNSLTRLTPALNILYKYPTHSKILAHSFSNGGAFTLSILAREFHRVLGRSLPIASLVLDSSPGKFRYRATVSAFSLGFPQFWIVHFLCMSFLYSLFGGYKILLWVFGGMDLIERIRRDLNDEVIFGRDARRLYVFSEGDAMVRWEDVEEHAEEAGRRGFGGNDGVMRVKFGETTHCGHLVGEENRGRYIRALERVWDGRG